MNRFYFIRAYMRGREGEKKKRYFVRPKGILLCGGMLKNSDYSLKDKLKYAAFAGYNENAKINKNAHLPIQAECAGNCEPRGGF